MTAQTDTPRTDAAWKIAEAWDGLHNVDPLLKEMRQLERDNAALKAELSTANIGVLFMQKRAEKAEAELSQMQEQLKKEYDRGWSRAINTGAR